MVDSVVICVPVNGVDELSVRVLVDEVDDEIILDEIELEVVLLNSKVVSEMPVLSVVVDDVVLVKMLVIVESEIDEFG